MKKLYFCKQYPSLIIGRDIRFERGQFTTEDPALQASIKAHAAAFGIKEAAQGGVISGPMEVPDGFLGGNGPLEEQVIRIDDATQKAFAVLTGTDWEEPQEAEDKPQDDGLPVLEVSELEGLSLQELIDLAGSYGVKADRRNSPITIVRNLVAASGGSL